MVYICHVIIALVRIMQHDKSDYFLFLTNERLYFSFSIYFLEQSNVFFIEICYQTITYY